MSTYEQNPPAPAQYPAPASHGYGTPPGQAGGYGAYPQAMPSAPAGYDRAPVGPVGKVRNTWVVMLLTVVTFGIYSLVYYYLVHEEMKKHTGEGLGGVLGLVIAFFVGFVSPFLLSHEVGNLYARQGRPQPVSAVTGLWVVPGFLIVVGPFVWLFKTNGALNDYWRSVGAA